MIILINGPLGIGKTSLAEALMESLDACVMLDGDYLIAANPEPVSGLELLHSTIELLVPHYQRSGYKHFVISHIWTTQSEINDLQDRLYAHDDHIRCFLLTLSFEENLKRIHRRASTRVMDELDFELQNVTEERSKLGSQQDNSLGEPIDVSGSLTNIVNKVLMLLDL